jgi:PAS domain S-box-containing protein
VEANLTVARFLGIERGRLLKTPFSLYVMPEDRDRFRECQGKVFQIPGRQTCEMRLKRKVGDPVWGGLESVAVDGPDAKSTGVRLVLFNITERKRAEEAMKQSEKQLPVSLRREGPP